MLASRRFYRFEISSAAAHPRWRLAVGRRLGAAVFFDFKCSSRREIPPRPTSEIIAQDGDYKSLSPWERWRRSRRRGERVRQAPSHPLSRKLSLRESLWMRSCSLEGTGFARSLFHTKAKLWNVFSAGRRAVPWCRRLFRFRAFITAAHPHWRLVVGRNYRIRRGL